MNTLPAKGAMVQLEQRNIAIAQMKARERRKGMIIDLSRLRL